MGCRFRGVPTDGYDAHICRYPGPEGMYEYDLFAVINHEGQMDNGHYTNFARFRDEVGRCFSRLAFGLKHCAVVSL